MDKYTIETIIASLARLEEAVAGCRKDIKKNHDVSVLRLNDHGKRVSSLERSRAKLLGMMAATSAVVVSALAWLGLGD